MLTDGVAVVNSLLRAQPTQDASRNTPEIRTGQRSQITPVWWNGRHSRLKICGLKRVGSNPTIGTISIEVSGVSSPTMI